MVINKRKLSIAKFSATVPFCHSTCRSLQIEEDLKNAIISQKTITQRMADQERSDLYVVFTMILCGLKSEEILLTFNLSSYGYQIKSCFLVKQFETNL